MQPKTTNGVDSNLARDLLALAELAPDLKPQLDAAASAPQTAMATAPGALRVLDLDELAALPPPTWLIDGMVPRGGFAVLYGPSGAGKSFLALDWALSVAYGQAWQDRPTQAGAVVYIAGEGVGGLAQRVAAWRQYHDRASRAPFYIIRDTVNLLESTTPGAVLAALALRDDQAPALVIIDTLARTMVGGDENGTRDMGAFIANADQIRRATGATVLIVHHTGKDTSRGERGSSALRAAADTMIALDAEGTLISVTCDKQKDAPPFAQIGLERVKVGASCVLTAGTVITSQRVAISPTAYKVLAFIGNPILSGGAKSAEIATGTRIAEWAVYRVLKELDDAGLLDYDKPPGTRGRHFWPTQAGYELLAITSNTSKSLTASYCEQPSPVTQSLTSTSTSRRDASASKLVSDGASESVLPAKPKAQPGNTQPAAQLGSCLRCGCATWLPNPTGPGRLLECWDADGHCSRPASSRNGAHPEEVHS
jgi:hypothetical protein